MNINGISSLMNTATSATTNTTATDKSGKNAFMTLLVEQLKHQDPTQPQDGAQFVTQLAQFNSLDQLIGIKSSIDQLITMSKGTDTTTNP